MSVRFETQTIAVEVTLAEGLSMRGNLYLQHSPLHANGLETPLDLMNRPEPFFALRLASGEVVLVPKIQVAFIQCDHAEGTDDGERLQVATVLQLRVIMTGGTEFRGKTVVELPPTHARPLDFLNTPEAFFSLDTDTSTTYIQRSQVRFVSSPMD